MKKGQSKQSKQKKQTMNRELTIDLKALNEETRQFELSFSSEEPYTRWFGDEILSHEPGAIDLSRLNEIGCVLYNHNRDKVIGRIDNSWVKDNRGYANVTFDEDAESDVIYQKVRSGTLKAVSVGYRVENWEEVAAGSVSTDGKHPGPCSIGLKWQPYEISIVSVPADPTVGVGREMEEEEEETEVVIEKSIDYSLYERQMQINQNYIGGK
ncbi:HK97 family phage prohead protease [Sporosarcina sp. FSL K6-5500]|uniref:HK97 family phage prohead protease n=1 Tax=Sporosarcina sp. FSL K6-5500 TaxID=2921558 RepID=UPI0030F8FCEA